jgi:ADP-ribose pyrophosphatase YjhB (NUDIX family)
MKEIKQSAGLVIIKNNKILLVAQRLPYNRNIYSIPKGKINEDESIIDAAIRETYEETGINIDKKLLNNEKGIIEYKTDKGIVYKKITYYVVYLTTDFEFDHKFNTTEIEKIGLLFWRHKNVLKHLE